MGKGWSGTEVTQARAFWAPRVAAGGMICPKCRRPIVPGSRWTVGHQVDRMDGGPKVRTNELPEHPSCNFSAGGKRGAAITNARRAVVRRRAGSNEDRGIRGW